jgi:hypothetical protein
MKKTALSIVFPVMERWKFHNAGGIIAINELALGRAWNIFLCKAGDSLV